MGVDYSGLRDLAAHLRTVPDRVEVAVVRAVSRGAFRTVASAQVLAPVDTGALKNSISADLDADGLGFVAGPEVNYGHFLEDGTSGPYQIPGAFGRPGSVTHPGIAPQPYMGPAFDQQVTKVSDEIADQAKAILG